MDPNERESKRKRSESEEPWVRTMEIVKGMENDEELVVIETKIISQLIQNIEDEKVKTLIECFNPVIRNSTDYIKEQMLDCSDKWENRKEIFMGAISYIIHSRQDKYKDEELKEMDTDRLSKILTTEIENRMPTFCKKCEEWYVVQFNDQPKMHCMWCRVGIHDCEDMKEMNKYPGMKWLCTKCEPIFIKHFLPKLDQFSLFQGFSTEKNTDKTSKIDKEIKKNNGEKTGVVEAIEIDESEDDEDEDNDNDGNDNGGNDNNGSDNDNNGSDNDGINNDNSDNESNGNNGGNNGNNDNGNVGNNSDNNKIAETPKEICWFWKNRNCKYLTKCKLDHPERCTDMIKTGLCKDNRCKKIHPKICRNLFFNKYCHRGDSCWYIHPLNIKNNIESNQNNQNQYNNYNYNNNRNQNNQNQNTNYKHHYTNKNFLPQRPQIEMGMGWGNTQNNSSTWREEPQGMMQMMQTMMQQMMRLDNKIQHIETGGMYLNRNM